MCAYGHRPRGSGQTGRARQTTETKGGIARCSCLTEKKSDICRVDFLCINKMMLMVYSDLGVIVCVDF